MTILKIKNVGDEATLAIAEVEVVPSTDPKMGNQVKFTTLTGDEVYVGESAVIRQLTRCGVEELSDLAGKIIHFSRAANKNPKFPPYWNLDRANEADFVKAANGNGKPPIASALPTNKPKHVPGDEDDSAYADSLMGDVDNSGSSFATLKSRYKECVDFASVAWGKDTSDVALVAAAATLFIERSRRGI